jgi:predicted DNA-binding transcriptional regulator AlpA
MTPWGRILPSKEMCKCAGNMSAATEWRLAQKGEGPPRIKLSPQRWGYPEDLFNEWLRSRFERPLPASPKTEAARTAQEQHL